MTQANSIPANPTLAIPALASAAQPSTPQGMAAPILAGQAPPHPRPRQTSKFAKAYAAAWTLLAGLALAYMAALAFHPSMLGDLAVSPATPDAQAQSQAIARFSTDLVGVKSTVGEIQKEVTALRSTLTASVVREKEVLDRLVAVEERTRAPLVAEVVAPKTAAQRQAELRAQKAAERAAAAQAAAAAKAAAAAPAAVASADPAPPAPSPAVTVLNPAPNPIATGSIPAPAAGLPAPPAPQAAPAAAAAPPTFGPGQIKATAAAPAAVELGTGPSLDALRLNWSLLSDRHGGSLKNLEARYLNAGEGQPYSLVAGPIASAEEAARVCAQLKSKQVSCRVTGFGGNAL